jgi:hypothetical protein
MANKIIIPRRNLLLTGGNITAVHVEAFCQSELIICRIRYLCRLRMYTGC